MKRAKCLAKISDKDEDEDKEMDEDVDKDLKEDVDEYRCGRFQALPCRAWQNWQVPVRTATWMTEALSRLSQRPNRNTPSLDDLFG